MRYWAWHQIDEDPNFAPFGGPGTADGESNDTESKMDHQFGGIGTNPLASQTPSKKQDKEKEKIITALEDSSDESKNQDDDSDNEIAGYNANAAPIKYKLLNIIPPKDDKNAIIERGPLPTLVN